MEIRPARAGDFDVMWGMRDAGCAAFSRRPFAGAFEGSTFRTHWFQAQTPHAASTYQEVASRSAASLPRSHKIMGGVRLIGAAMACSGGGNAGGFCSQPVQRRLSIFWQCLLR